MKLPVHYCPECARYDNTTVCKYCSGDMVQITNTGSPAPETIAKSGSLPPDSAPVVAGTTKEA